MPVKACSANGKPGFKYGDSGTCYTHDGSDAGKAAAKQKAVKQAVAIGGGKAPADLAELELESAGLKKCAQCGFYRSRAQFVTDGRTTDGRAKLCVDCRFHSDREYADKPLETVDLPGVDILSAGGPYFGQGSPEEGDSFDESFLKELATANTELAQEIKVPIKIGHSKAQRLLKNSGLYTDEMPAAGWLENFRVSNGKLLTDLRAVPKKIAALIEAGGFRTRSVEMKPVKSQTKDGKEYPAVISALALLGAKAPAVRTLDDVLTSWYAEDDDDVPTAATLLTADVEPDEEMRTVDYAEGDVIWDGENGANDWRDDLQAALNTATSPAGTTSTGPESMSPYYVQDVDQINRKAIVCDYRTNTNWVIGFGVDENGEPVPAPQETWTLAEQAWVQASQDSAGTPAAVEAGDFSDATGDSRSSGDTRDMPPREQPTVSELSEEQVAEIARVFGINEDDAAKRREAVFAKFGEHSATPAPPTPPPTPPVPEPPPTPTPAEPQAVQLSEDEFTQLKADAKLARDLAEKQRTERVDATVDLAIGQFRIDPADRDEWRSFGEENYDLMVKSLCKIEPRVELAKSFGVDDKAEGDRADEGYRVYAAATGVPTREVAQ